MHEMSIAASLLEAVEAESARHNAHIATLGLKIGELSGVDAESLRFCFDILVRDTRFSPLALDIQFLPWRNRCRRCTTEFPVRDYRTDCPECGSAETELAGGNELEFAYMEIEQS